MKRQKNIKKIMSFLIFLMGFILCSYPLISSMVERQYQKDAVATYTKEVEGIREEDTRNYFEEANQYNSILYQSGSMLIEAQGSELLSEESYNHILNISDTGVMGSIDIPKINVNLPIYHGISEEVLSVGVGHLEGSSLPVGGKNTRTILTGHRGLPNSKLFTRLDEIEKEDLFFIHVLGNTLAYQVKEIDVIKPDETDSLHIIPDKDLATLITCTPYGINTHRLVITGERVTYEQKEYDEIMGEMMSLREIIFAFIPFAFLMIAVISHRKNKKREG
ncbi:MAG: class C sortase [Oliverpabstia sp.]